MEIILKGLYFLNMSIFFTHHFEFLIKMTSSYSYLKNHSLGAFNYFKTSKFISCHRLSILLSMIKYFAVNWFKDLIFYDYANILVIWQSFCQHLGLTLSLRNFHYIIVYILFRCYVRCNMCYINYVLWSRYIFSGL